MWPCLGGPAEAPRSRPHSSHITHLPGAGHPWEDWPCPLAGRAPEGPEGAPPKAQGSLGWEADQALPCLGRREGRAGSPTQPGAQLLGKGQAGPSSLKPIPPAGVSADQGTPRTSPQWPRSPAACSHPPSTGLCEDGYLVPCPARQHPAVHNWALTRRISRTPKARLLRGHTSSPSPALGVCHSRHPLLAPHPLQASPPSLPGSSRITN